SSQGTAMATWYLFVIPNLGCFARGDHFTPQLLDLTIVSLIRPFSSGLRSPSRVVARSGDRATTALHQRNELRTLPTCRTAPSVNSGYNGSDRISRDAFSAWGKSPSP